MKTTLAKNVLEFLTKHQFEYNPEPVVPKLSTMQLRSSALMEECFEYLEGLYKGNDQALSVFAGLKQMTLNMIEVYKPAPSLPDVADAFADIDYCVEAIRLAFGIDGDPIAKEVHRANMDKVFTSPAVRKVKKPFNWQPPDIRQCLLAQGWIPGGTDDI